jgi:uncharacterized protein YydD (DUF2326 family)
VEAWDHPKGTAMIHRIYSTLPKFKTLEFHPGFNVLLAEKTPGARKDQTRNAAGKSTALEIIHYLLGAELKKDSIFLDPAIAAEMFGMTFDCAGQKTTVERVANPDAFKNSFYILGDVPAGLTSDIKTDDKGESYVPLKAWRSYLGQAAFNLAAEPATFEPKFRSLFSYFCRRDDAAFFDPKRQSLKQAEWDQDVATAFFLGLDWRILSAMEKLRKREQELRRLKSELAGSGVVAELIGTAAQLRARLAVQRAKADGFGERLASFKVLPEYEEFEKEASRLRSETGELRDGNTLDRQLVEQLEAALRDEHAPQEMDVARLYEAVGIQLPGVATKHLEDIRKFHQTIVQNRQKHLASEISAAKRRIETRTASAESKEIRERELMQMLKGRGALKHYTELQLEHSRMRAEVDELERRLKVAHRIETGAADLNVERAELHRQLVNDHAERAPILEEAVILFDELSRTLSERSSVLRIEPTETGLSIKVEGGPDARATGIKEQQVFCFDMMLAVLLSRRRPNWLGFLVHDSRLFDAMDERQIASAFEVGAKMAAKHGFQYIVTLNDDRVPHRDFSSGFDLKKYELPVRLTDATEDGGLLGCRLSKAAS